MLSAVTGGFLVLRLLFGGMLLLKHAACLGLQLLLMRACANCLHLSLLPALDAGVLSCRNCACCLPLRDKTPCICLCSCSRRR